MVYGREYRRPADGAPYGKGGPAQEQEPSEGPAKRIDGDDRRFEESFRRLIDSILTGIVDIRDDQVKP